MWILASQTVEEQACSILSQDFAAVHRLHHFIKLFLSTFFCAYSGSLCRRPQRQWSSCIVHYNSAQDRELGGTSGRVSVFTLLCWICYVLIDAVNCEARTPLASCFFRDSHPVKQEGCRCERTPHKQNKLSRRDSTPALLALFGYVFEATASEQ